MVCLGMRIRRVVLVAGGEQRQQGSEDSRRIIQ